jgi:hypothetical protein
VVRILQIYVGILQEHLANTLPERPLSGHAKSPGDVRHIRSVPAVPALVKHVVKGIPTIYFAALETSVVCGIYGLETHLTLAALIPQVMLATFGWVFGFLRQNPVSPVNSSLNYVVFGSGSCIGRTQAVEFVERAGCHRPGQCVGELCHITSYLIRRRSATDCKAER